MTKPRNSSMNPLEIETHHVWSRVVQRAMLIGVDPMSKVDYGERREILRSLLQYQAETFAVDVGNYAILGNHFHAILRSRPDIVATWSDEECAFRYKSAWPTWVDAIGQFGHRVDDDGIYHRKGDWRREPTDEEIEDLLKTPGKMPFIREFLGSISGFMAQVKQPVAELFNKETSVTGSYWGRRFGNRRLESWSEIIGGSFYVDLNHARAGTATSLDTSHCSAIQDRLLAAEARRVWIEANTDTSLDQIYQDHVHGSSNLPPKVLEKLFGDAWLAPITDCGPRYSEDLNRIKSESESESESVQFNESHPSKSDSPEFDDTSGERTGETSESDPAPVDPVTQESDDSQPSTPRRPGKPRTTSILRRLRRRMKRRKSDWCFIDTALTAYLETVRKLAAEIVAGQCTQELKEQSVSVVAGNESDATLPDPNPCSVDWRTTAADVYRDFRGFLAGTLEVIASALSPTVATSDISNSSTSAPPSTLSISGEPPPPD